MLNWPRCRQVVVTSINCSLSLSLSLDWIVQCFTSPPTQYRLYGTDCSSKQGSIISLSTTALLNCSIASIVQPFAFNPVQLWQCLRDATKQQGWASECPGVKNYKWQLNPVWHVNYTTDILSSNNSSVRMMIRTANRARMFAPAPSPKHITSFSLYSTSALHSTPSQLSTVSLVMHGQMAAVICAPLSLT